MATTINLPEGATARVHPISRNAGRTYGCEHLTRYDDTEGCGKPADRFIVATAPGFPAGNGKTENRYACSAEHATALAESLWGIGYDFPEEA